MIPPGTTFAEARAMYMRGEITQEELVAYYEATPPLYAIVDQLQEEKRNAQHVTAQRRRWRWFRRKRNA